MKKSADIIVIGGGLFGCATAYNLAKLGAKNVVLLERGAICSGSTAKSCAIVRTHYSIRANMIHAVESLRVFENFDHIVGGDVGFRRTGYLILGPEEHREPMQAVFRAQNEHGIDTATLTPQEAREIHPLVACDDVDVIGYDSLAGYCDPYLTTIAYAQRAKELGVTIYTDTPVRGIQTHGQIKTVQTPSGSIEGPVLIIAAGPWTHAIGRLIGIDFPYTASRHKVVTLKTSQPYRMEWPIVKDLTTPDKIYLRSTTDGAVLVGTGDHGDPVDDADILTDQIEDDHVARIYGLITRLIPAFAESEYCAGWTGPYDITPDWNPIVGPVPGVEGVHVMVGFSGHGFKLAPTISESLAQTVLGTLPRIPIDMYSMTRFSEGKALQGAYGIGSLS